MRRCMELVGASAMLACNCSRMDENGDVPGRGDTLKNDIVASGGCSSFLVRSKAWQKGWGRARDESLTPAREEGGSVQRIRIEAISLLSITRLSTRKESPPLDDDEVPASN